MNKYQNGKIYKLTCDNSPLIYYGSTCQKYLSRRLSGHKSDSSNNNGRCSSKQLFELGNVSIHLVEEYPCNSKMELELRERIYIEFMLKNFDYKIICNLHYPRRSKSESSKEWYKIKKNKEKQKEYKENNEALKLYRKQTINCECGGQYVITNKQRHLKTKKHLAHVANQK